MFFENGFYYFGGNSGDSFGTLEKINCLDSKTFLWSTVGALLEKRQKNNVIEVQGQFLILGGEIKKDGLLGTVQTEKCVFEETKLQCSEQDPLLENYSNFPELFHISEDYCR